MLELLPVAIMLIGTASIVIGKVIAYMGVVNAYSR